MMRLSRGRLWLTLGLAMLSACGGGGGGGSTPTPPPSGGTPPPSGGTPPPSSCGLRDRQLWAQGVIREWYLFPETLPATLDPAPYATVQDYIDALTATARAQRRDRFFTHLTSIAEENAFFATGASAGFGFRVSTDTAQRRAFITEAFEGAPALNAGIDRGDELLAIGDTPGTLRAVADIIAAGGSSAVTDALGPSDPGVTRTLRVAGPSGTRDLTITKADYSLTPVSSRYGAKVIDDGGRRVGYLNLRTFISSADPQLRFAFDGFRQQGITEFVIDFRYNGGGLIDTAELMGDLLGGNRSATEVFSSFVYRPEKAANNSTKRFAPTAQSVAPTKIAFIATGATASASEVVINGLLPYYGANLGLIGANTFGKPVGQVALDRSACDDRLRVVAFSSRNSANSDNYYDGLAATVTASCRAADEVARPLGDPQEASLRQALDYLAGRACTPISVGQTAQSVADGRLNLRPLPPPTEATPAQREVPGSF
jgi:C-terminal processing protease CtpA/Prc